MQNASQGHYGFVESQDLEHSAHENVHVAGQKRVWLRVTAAALGLCAAIVMASAFTSAGGSDSVISSTKKFISAYYIAPPWSTNLCPEATLEDFQETEMCSIVPENVDTNKYNINTQFACQKFALISDDTSSEPGSTMIYYFKDSTTPYICHFFKNANCEGDKVKYTLPQGAANQAGKWQTCTIMSPQCFPGESRVHVQGRGETSMSNVNVGDKIRVSSGEGDFVYEEVLSFLHHAPDADGIVTQVSHTGGEFRATENHLVFVSGDNGRSSKNVGSLQAGDVIFTERNGYEVASSVLSIRKGVARSGMFAPLTASGSILVDGVVASIYGTPNHGILPHGAAHAAFFVARVWHIVVSSLGLLSTPASGVHPLADFFVDLGLDRILHPMASKWGFAKRGP